MHTVTVPRTRPSSRSKRKGKGEDRHVLSTAEYSFDAVPKEQEQVADWHETVEVRSASDPAGGLPDAVVRAGGSRRVVAAIAAAMWRLQWEQQVANADLCGRTHRHGDAARVHQAFAARGYEHHTLGLAINMARDSGALEGEALRAAHRVRRQSNWARHASYAFEHKHAVSGARPEGSGSAPSQLPSSPACGVFDIFDAGDRTDVWHANCQHHVEHQVLAALPVHGARVYGHRPGRRRGSDRLANARHACRGCDRLANARHAWAPCLPRWTLIYRQTWVAACRCKALQLMVMQLQETLFASRMVFLTMLTSFAIPNMGPARVTSSRMKSCLTISGWFPTVMAQIGVDCRGQAAWNGGCCKRL